MPGPITGGSSGSSLSKATGAEVDAGTDDAKYVTAKAIADSDYIKEADLPPGGGLSGLTTGQYLKATSATEAATDGVKRYVALLTQTGTDAPVATVLENTLGGTVVWTRVEAGKYDGTLAGAFPDITKVFLPNFITVSEGGVITGTINIVRQTADAVEFDCYDANGDFADGILSYATTYMLEIRVYQ